MIREDLIEPMSGGRYRFIIDLLGVALRQEVIDRASSGRQGAVKAVTHCPKASTRL
ncbi:hypothetical protein ACF1B0_35940 [Streptomyces anandii]|uniref:hypothetical protein n=1 Tax=Streptomyces anandii TaxID=285454 RepID=UPI0037019792